MDIKESVADFILHITWGKLIRTVIAGLVIISLIAIYENRQVFFNKINFSLNNTVDDFELKPPRLEGQKIIASFMNKNKEVVMLSVLDANPVTNRRNVVYRDFNDSKIKTLVDRYVLENPTVGDGALFTTDPINNKQILAILNGEFFCAENKNSIITQAFPGAAKQVVYSCRVPLPPSFGKATGWITLHLNKWPLEDYDQFKSDALLMSLNYYNREVLVPQSR